MGGKTTYAKQRAVLEAVGTHFNNPNYSDVAIRGPDDQLFYCSKLHLCATSDVLEEEIAQRSAPEAAGSLLEIKVENVDPEALQMMLEFVHTGRCEIEGITVVPLTSIADKFNVKLLSELCESYEKEHLRVDKNNCYTLMAQCQAYHKESLLKRCQVFMAKNIETMRERSDFIGLDFDLVKGINQCSFDAHGRCALTSSQYYSVVQTSLDWLYHEWPDRKQYTEGLFCEFRLTMLSQIHLQWLCASKMFQKTPSTAYHLVQALAEDPPETFEEETENLHGCVGEFALQGVWRDWEVPSTDWYHIVAKGGEAMGHGEHDGGGGAVVCGAFLLNQGDKLKILVGKGGTQNHRGGGGCCVVMIPWNCFKLKLMMVAGGGGAAALEAKGESADLNPVNTNGMHSKRPIDGRGCALKIAEESSPFLLHGACDWCNGGVGVGGGGGGFYGGDGGSTGGKGGSSYLNAIAKHGRTFGWNYTDLNPHVGIWRGKEHPENL